MLNTTDYQYNGEYEIIQDLNNPRSENVAAPILDLLGFGKPEEFKISLIKYLF